MVSPPHTTKLGGETARLGAQFQEVARILNAHFLDKQEIIRLLLVSAIAGEHMVIIGRRRPAPRWDRGRYVALYG